MTTHYISHAVFEDMEFEAVFCPDCGTCVNEPDPDWIGSDPVVLCGWCHEHHYMSQIKVCRNLLHLNPRQHEAGVEAHMLVLRESLLATRERLVRSRAMGDDTAQLFFTHQELEVLKICVQRALGSDDQRPDPADLWPLHTALAEAQFTVAAREEAT